ncbi:ferredoxin [Defluviimonas sp. WL0002]|uniref:Ferredoxin n=1 Tax=Albidovulum marisflavi TaxID=2984159 RepID=A0ABT2ZDY5_9RHOB|nr:ferredoxin [Defluviimonas sp. WL0002]MCV2869342.1 ferredoxin [Defluviimonas sp. WL0002]
MSTLQAIADLARPHSLAVFGAFHPGPDDSAPPGTGTLLLFGPAEPGFWPHLTSQPEWQDGDPDPIDRWSKRALGSIAADLGARAIFPSDGPPYAPFFRWALSSGRAWASPVRLLVHDSAGLWVSYRGALALGEKLELPDPPANPCDVCEAKPCLSACPALALTGAGYDLPGCHAWLDQEQGDDCLSLGCAVRRACPVSQAYGRLPEQSAYHMRQFHR